MKMAGNPNWWAFFNNGISSINSNSNSSTMLQHSLSHQSSTYSENSTVSVPAQHCLPHHSSQLLDFPVHIRSCSQLLLGGLSEEKKVNQENWEEQVLNLVGTNEGSVIRVSDDDVKLQGLIAAHQSTNSQIFNYNDHWNNDISSSSPNSCATTALRNSSSFSLSGGRKTAAAEQGKRNQYSQEQSSQQYSTSSGGVQPKKPRVQPALKVRKEKLGDRITALHQLVSPFGKTDTASVLSEAIGYIRFLHGQIEVLNEHIGMDGRGVPNPNQEELGKDLRSRGLCLVPTSCTLHFPNDGGADFWAPAPFGGGGAGGF